jgi:hypothetical protein
MRFLSFLCCFWFLVPYNFEYNSQWRSDFATRLSDFPMWRSYCATANYIRDYTVFIFCDAHRYWLDIVMYAPVRLCTSAMMTPDYVWQWSQDVKLGNKHTILGTAHDLVNAFDRVASPSARHTQQNATQNTYQMLLPANILRKCRYMIVHGCTTHDYPNHYLNIVLAVQVLGKPRTVF